MAENARMKLESRKVVHLPLLVWSMVWTAWPVGALNTFMPVGTAMIMV